MPLRTSSMRTSRASTPSSTSSAQAWLQRRRSSQPRPAPGSAHHLQPASAQQRGLCLRGGGGGSSLGGANNAALHAGWSCLHGVPAACVACWCALYSMWLVSAPACGQCGMFACARARGRRTEQSRCASSSHACMAERVICCLSVQRGLEAGKAVGGGLPFRVLCLCASMIRGWM